VRHGILRVRRRASRKLYERSAGHARGSAVRRVVNPPRPRRIVKLAPWEYLFRSFSSANFPDLFQPTWVASLVLLVLVVILYNVRTRQLHRHPPYLDLYEWLLWTGLITFSLLLIESVFVFDFFLVLTTIAIGLGTLVWVRFRRFPPILAGYEHKLARERYFSRTRFARPEATIRPKLGRRSRRRR
jgi:hypothetical protein